MTEEQHQHLNKIKEETAKRLDHTYTKGQAEHGGDLWEHSPLWLNEQILEEATDEMVYAQTERDEWIKYLRLVTTDPDAAIRLAEEWLKEVK